jgi:uncharacterized protein (TIGR03437 family)
VRFIALCVLIVGALALQGQSGDPPPAIEKNGVRNAASEMPPMLSGGALARGSLIHIHGWRLGPKETIHASGFPLRTELAGMAIEIRQTSTSVRAIPLSVNVNLIEAILPSDAPLGHADLFLLRGDSVSEPSRIRIVPASFGASTFATSTWGQEGFVYNGSSENAGRNATGNAARPGQTVTLIGTGLGAAPDSGGQAPHRVPIPVTQLSIRVAGKPVSGIRYAGRSACCSGQDELVFDLPVDTPEGCHVPIQVESAPGIESNVVSLAVGHHGGACSDPGDWISPRTEPHGAAGLIILHRSNMLLALGKSGSALFVTDAGFAKFVADPLPQNNTGRLLGFPPPGTCSGVERITRLRGMLTTLSPLDLIEGKALDAGDRITVESERGKRSFGRPKGEGDTYAGVLGGNSPLPSSTSQPLFLRPGAYRISGQGSATGAFETSVHVSQPIRWTDRDSIQSVDRARGVTVHWKAGNPDDFLLISAANIDGDSGALGMAVCVVPAKAGSFTIPAVALANVPPSAIDDRLPLSLLWLIEVPGHAPEPFRAGDVDQAVAFYTSSSVRTVAFR